MGEIIREIPNLNENAIENDGVIMLAGEEKLTLRVVSIDKDCVTLSLEGSPERIELMAKAEQSIRLDQATPGAASID